MAQGLKPIHNAAAAAQYHEKDFAEYYLEGNKAPSRWLGHGAELLGLECTMGIKEADYTAVLHRRDPHNHSHKLTGRAPSDRAALAYEFTEAPPKSFSIAAALDPRLMAIQNAAVDAVVERMQMDAQISAQANVKRGRGGRATLRNTDNFVVAHFRHKISRSLDVHYHDHVQIMSVSFDEVTRKWYAVQGEILFKDQTVYRDLYMATLAHELRNAGNYELVGTDERWEIKGISLPLRQMTSKGRQRILSDREVSESQLRKKLATVLRKKGVDIKQRAVKKGEPPVYDIAGIKDAFTGDRALGLPEGTQRLIAAERKKLKATMGKGIPSLKKARAEELRVYYVQKAAALDLKGSGVDVILGENYAVEQIAGVHEPFLNQDKLPADICTRLAVAMAIAEKKVVFTVKDLTAADLGAIGSAAASFGRAKKVAKEDEEVMNDLIASVHAAGPAMERHWERAKATVAAAIAGLPAPAAAAGEEGLDHPILDQDAADAAQMSIVWGKKVTAAELTPAFAQDQDGGAADLTAKAPVAGTAEQPSLGMDMGPQNQAPGQSGSSGSKDADSFHKAGSETHPQAPAAGAAPGVNGNGPTSGGGPGPNAPAGGHAGNAKSTDANIGEDGDPTEEKMRQDGEGGQNAKKPRADHRIKAAAKSQVKRTLTEAIRVASDEIFGVCSVVTRRAMAAYVLDHTRYICDATGKVYRPTPKEVFAAIGACPEFLVAKPADQPNEVSVTTRATMAREARVVALFAASQSTVRAMRMPTTELGGDFGKVFKMVMSQPDQRAALEGIVNSTNGITRLCGRAGTGKSTVLEALHGVAQNNGVRVFAYAPTIGVGRYSLREAGFKDANTVSHFMLAYESLGLGPKDMIIIDEAGTVGMAQMEKIGEIRAKYGCRVLLSGDTVQLNPGAVGDALRIVEDRAGLPGNELTTVRRQTDAGLKIVAELANAGKTVEALEKLDSLGFVRQLKPRATDAMDGSYENDYGPAVDAFLAAEKAAKVDPAKDKRDKVVLLAMTWNEIDNGINPVLRAKLKARGDIDASTAITYKSLEDLTWKAASKTDPTCYQEALEQMAAATFPSAPSRLAVKFHSSAGRWKKGSTFEVLEVAGGKVRVRDYYDSSAKIKDLNLKYAAEGEESGKFGVYKEEEIEICAGDRVIVANSCQRTVKGKVLASGIRANVTSTAGGQIVLSNGQIVDARGGSLAHRGGRTVHSAHGESPEACIVTVDNRAARSSGCKELYDVLLTRGKGKTVLFAESFPAMIEHADDTMHRMLGHEMGQDVIDRAAGPAGTSPVEAAPAFDPTAAYQAKTAMEHADEERAPSEEPSASPDEEPVL